MPTSTDNTNNCALVKFCPAVNLNKDFLHGALAVTVLGVGYWFVRCRGRTC